MGQVKKMALERSKGGLEVAEAAEAEQAAD